MEHCPDETLALLALGEPVGLTALSQHLTTCPICRSHLDELAHTVNVARSVTTGDSLTSPPDSTGLRGHPGVWLPQRPWACSPEALGPQRSRKRDPARSCPLTFPVSSPGTDTSKC